MAFMPVLLGLPFLLHVRRDNRPAARSHTPSLVSAWQRPGIRRGLLATAVHVLGQTVKTERQVPKERRLIAAYWRKGTAGDLG